MYQHSYQRVILNSALLGVVGGVIGLAYLFIVETATHALWPEEESFEWFSGGPETVIIPLVAGLIVGLLYKVLKIQGRFKGFITELKKGTSSPRPFPLPC